MSGGGGRELEAEDRLRSPDFHPTVPLAPLDHQPGRAHQLSPQFPADLTPGSFVETADPVLTEFRFPQDGVVDHQQWYIPRLIERENRPVERDRPLQCE